MKKLLIIALLFVGCGVLQEEDCAGVAGGTAVKDDCGVCDNDSSNDCLQDCSGVWGGNTTQEYCDSCISGIFDCAGVCGGDSIPTFQCQNACVVCNLADCSNLDSDCDGCLADGCRRKL